MTTTGPKPPTPFVAGYTPPPYSPPDWLGIGTVLLIDYGSGGQQVEIIARREDCFAVRFVGFCSWQEVMTDGELRRRNAVPMPKKAPRLIWWRRWFA